MSYDLRSDWHPTTGQMWVIVCRETQTPHRVFIGPQALERAQGELEVLRRKATPPKLSRTQEARAVLLANLRHEDDVEHAAEKVNKAAREGYRRRQMQKQARAEQLRDAIMGRDEVA